MDMSGRIGTKQRTGVDWDLKSSPGHLVNRAARLFARIGEGRLRVLGFGVGQLPVLAMLKDGTSLSQKELALRARIEQPSMAQMLARMDRDGLTRRQPDPSDRRSSLISLTKIALARLPEARAVLQRGNAEALADFSREEAATLASLLKRVIANLEHVADGETASTTR